MNKTSETKSEISNPIPFFPRIIREFEDHEEPMMYGG